MDQQDLRRLDMTALLVFRHLMRQRQTVAVAAQLGITQSAVSHALSRLRGVFDDPLFLRRPHGLEPTLRAQGLELPIDRAIAALEQVFEPPAPFDPDARGPLRIGGDELSLSLVLPPLISALESEAPGLVLRSQIMAEPDVISALEDGRLDAGIGAWVEAPHARTHLNALGSQPWQVVGRAGHPFFAASDPLSAYHKAGRIGLDGQAQYQAPSLMGVLAGLQQSHLLAEMPALTARRFCAALGLDSAPSPLRRADHPIALLRHARERTNPMLHWVAARLTAALR